MNRRTLHILVYIGLLCLSAGGQARDEITVTFEADIRELARTHLKNPDLWPDILRANGLLSAHQLQPGMSLTIPVRMILQVEETETQAREVIHQATQAGARVLAPEEINRAIRSHSAALEARRQGAWQTALEQAAAALETARDALATTRNKRNMPVGAVLESSNGTVQRRPPGTWSWLRAEEKSTLVEQEKLRTLSDSFAEVVFRDDSRLHLEANAELLIQKMRVDGLNRRKRTSVVLQGGDIYALLGSSRQHQGFDVKSQNVETKIDSKNFWMGKDKNTTRVANYDGKIEVSAGNAKVILAENQGTLIKGNRQPAVVKNLLPAPRDLQPADHTVVYRDGVNLGWQAAEETKATYWLEISTDKTFQHPMLSRNDLRENRFFWPLPADGLYYWRVAAVDEEGLPGPKSVVRVLQIQKDEEAPYLVLSQPPEQAVVRDATVALAGKTEHDAVLKLADRTVTLAANGEFGLEYSLTEGLNTLVLQAVDPAGNITRLQRQVRYLPDSEIPLSYDADLPRLGDKHFVVNQARFTLRGRTRPKVALQIRRDPADNFETGGFADDAGRFQINLPLRAEKQDFTLTATLPTGFSVSDTFSVERDTTPPPIVFTRVPPALTAKVELSLQGTAAGAHTLTVNDTNVRLDEQQGFVHPLKLAPGDNTLTLIATDLAGNITRVVRHTVLDQEPPQLRGQRLSRQYAKPGQTLRVEVRAEDAHGLRAGARYVLDIGGQTRRGRLSLCPAGNCYQHELLLPPGTQGKIVLRSVVLEDYAGNQQEYSF